MRTATGLPPCDPRLPGWFHATVASTRRPPSCRLWRARRCRHGHGRLSSCRVPRAESCRRRSPVCGCRPRRGTTVALPTIRWDACGSCRGRWPCVRSRPWRYPDLGNNWGKLAALGESTPALSVGRDPVIEPALHHLGVSRPALGSAPVQPDQLARSRGAPGDKPCRRSGVALAVVLPQPAVGALTIHRTFFGFAGGVVVVVDAPTR